MGAKSKTKKKTTKQTKKQTKGKGKLKAKKKTSKLKSPAPQITKLQRTYREILEEKRQQRSKGSNRCLGTTLRQTQCRIEATSQRVDELYRRPLINGCTRCGMHMREEDFEEYAEKTSPEEAAQLNIELDDRKN